MKTSEAWTLVGGLSKPSKMPGWSIGIPAKECKTGAKLRLIPNSVCEGCYALKGCYVFKVVQEAQYKRLEAINHPDWVLAMATLINSKKPDVFRWHDSGDVQDLQLILNKIFEVCRATPAKRHWMPTREAWIKDHMQDAPANLVVRFSSPMIDQGPVKSWANTSTVSTKNLEAVQPLTTTTSAAAVRACWDPLVKNIEYGKH